MKTRIDHASVTSRAVVRAAAGCLLAIGDVGALKITGATPARLRDRVGGQTTAGAGAASAELLTGGVLSARERARAGAALDLADRGAVTGRVAGVATNASEHTVSTGRTHAIVRCGTGVGGHGSAGFTAAVDSGAARAAAAARNGRDRDREPPSLQDVRRRHEVLRRDAFRATRNIMVAARTTDRPVLNTMEQLGGFVKEFEARRHHQGGA